MILPDLLAPHLRLVFCGTAPSIASAAARAYYAHPANKFWKILYETGMTSRSYAPEEYPLLLKEGIGLTDVNKIESGNDVDLTRAGFAPTALHEKIIRFQPQWLAFTSKRAAREGLELKKSSALEYGEQEARIGATRIFVLPSTSGAANSYWDVRPWQELANLQALKCNDQ